jgi:cysteinyl-tRNA synthetase
MLVGSLTLDGIKMSKSLGNTLTIDEALERWRPEAIRTFILSSHYRSPVDFSNAAIDGAHKGWMRLWSAVRLTREKMLSAPDGAVDAGVQAMLGEFRTTFVDKMNDDFNAPAGLATLQDLTREVNSLLNRAGKHTQGTLKAIDDLYQELAGDVLGLIPDEEQGRPGNNHEEGLMRLLIDLRERARNNKDWATADLIRNQLDQIGIQLEDRPEGTIWKESH